MTTESEQNPVPQNALSASRIERPFASTDAAHTVVRAAEALGWDLSDPDGFLRQAQHVEFGLSAEIEFAAILRWLGTCSLVHRLSEDALADDRNGRFQIPDLFAVFQSNSQTCSALIEVKTTKGTRLTFRRDYLDSLKAYAALIGKPLLIAWRPRQIGFWVLVDAALLQTNGGASFVLKFDTAIRNDLMSLLAGDFYIAPMVGAGLRIEARRVSERKLIEDGYTAEYQIENAYFHDAGGFSVPDLPDSVAWMILSMAEDHQEIANDKLLQSFVTRGGMTRAQIILRTAAGFRTAEGERIHWRQIGKNLDSILRCEELLHESQSRLGTFVRYIIFQQPEAVPVFISDKWRTGMVRKDNRN